MVAALICARGGSKRIYRKNVQMCAGMKLIEYPLTAAKGCKFIDKIYVSTDDIEINGIAKSYGAELIDQSPFHKGISNASSGAVSFHAYREIWKQNKNDLEYIVSLWATSPCIQCPQLEGAFSLLQNDISANVVSAVYEMTKPSQLNNFYALTGSNVMIGLFPLSPQGVNPFTTNNLVKTYYACGAFAIQKIGEIERNLFKETKDIDEKTSSNDANYLYARAFSQIGIRRASDLSNTSLGFVIDQYSGTDINYPEDLKMAEAILRFRGQGK
jgi:CMP-N-acetylneuraminic acid synthetase